MDAALAMLVDERLIAKSLVLPFRYLTALEAVQASNLPRAERGLAAINEAEDKALATSRVSTVARSSHSIARGSMAGRPLQIGSLFAAVLAKAVAGASCAAKADIMLFSDDAKFITVNLRDSTLTLAREIASRAAPAGTNFHAIFQRAQAAYDRIVILSDMQGWIGHHAPTQSFADYKRRTDAEPRCVSASISPATARSSFPSATFAALRASRQGAADDALPRGGQERAAAKSRRSSCRSGKPPWRIRSTGQGPR